jgi:hypothetical protein
LSNGTLQVAQQAPRLFLHLATAQIDAGELRLDGNHADVILLALRHQLFELGRVTRISFSRSISGGIL